jgi:FSR family fosmidomycin resistance protein-like MFS transporter
MAPALLLFLFLPGAFVYLGSFLAGFFVLASMPLGVAMAQRLAPKSRSMVSSLMMGFAYGLGGAFSPIVGKLGDIFGLESVLLYSAFVPILTLVLIARFPTKLKVQ